ncbi:MAG: hypothetical protein JXR95_13645 [Deltaproteobacteria bacterium]|nr:hypothetical protein [Deltaproteobacteria bacterium]
MKKDNDVFILKGGQLNPLPAKSIARGTKNKSLEDVFTELLENNPAIIPGNQVAPENDHPPKFINLGQKIRAGIWDLDFLFTDQYGVPTIIEMKLINNPEASRAVIGKIVEYSATVSREWNTEFIRKQAQDYWTGKGRTLEDVFFQAYGSDFNMENYWTLMELAIASGKIRSIIVSDDLRPEMKLMIEYLNSQLIQGEVLGLELKVYGNDGNDLLMIPGIIGQTFSVSSRKGLKGGSIQWSRELLQKELEEFHDPFLKSRINELIEFAISNDIFISGKTLEGLASFGLKGLSGERLFTIYLNGKISFFISEINDIDTIVKRDSLISSLKKMELLQRGFDAVKFTEIPFLSKNISRFRDREFREFLQLIKNFHGLE